MGDDGGREHLLSIGFKFGHITELFLCIGEIKSWYLEKMSIHDAKKSMTKCNDEKANDENIHNKSKIKNKQKENVQYTQKEYDDYYKCVNNVIFLEFFNDTETKISTKELGRRVMSLGRKKEIKSVPEYTDMAKGYNPHSASRATKQEVEKWTGFGVIRLDEGGEDRPHGKNYYYQKQGTFAPLISEVFIANKDDGVKLRKRIEKLNSNGAMELGVQWTNYWKNDEKAKEFGLLDCTREMNWQGLKQWKQQREDKQQQEQQLNQ